jgi:preprotein translocase subunit SecE
MFTASRYKRNQGRVARQVTFFAIVATVAIGAWRFGDWMTADVWARVIPDALESRLSPYVFGKYIVPALLAVLGTWAAFRIVNVPRFAEFLISVENEMSKVSWPSRGELFRASMVVIVVIFFLTAILFTYDLVLKAVISMLLGKGQ